METGVHPVIIACLVRPDVFGGRKSVSCIHGRSRLSFTMC